jgi:hypothetical protein
LKQRLSPGDLSGLETAVSRLRAATGSLIAVRAACLSSLSVNVVRELSDPDKLRLVVSRYDLTSLRIRVLPNVEAMAGDGGLRQDKEQDRQACSHATSPSRIDAEALRARRQNPGPRARGWRFDRQWKFWGHHKDQLRLAGRVSVTADLHRFNDAWKWAGGGGDYPMGYNPDAAAVLEVIARMEPQDCLQPSQRRRRCRIELRQG